MVKKKKKNEIFLKTKSKARMPTLVSLPNTVLEILTRVSRKEK